MKKYLLGAAALLAFAAPGAAHAASGYLGANYGNVDVDGLGDADVWGVDGSVAFQGTDTIGVELDGAVSDADDADTTTAATAHLFTRNDNYLFGGFAGVADNGDDTTWNAGVEANKYFQSWTLAGAIGYADDNDADVNGWGANAQGRFFVSDNFRLDASLGWFNVDTGVGDDADVTTYGVGGEYQLTELPISFGAGYTHFDTDGGDASTWSIALRYNFNSGTLRDRDRNGASQADLSGVSSALGL